MADISISYIVIPLHHHILTSSLAFNVNSNKAWTGIDVVVCDDLDLDIIMSKMILMILMIVMIMLMMMMTTMLMMLMMMLMAKPLYGSW